MDIKGKHIEFAKILVGCLVVIYYVFYVFSIIYWFKEDRYIEDMLDYIYRPFAVVVSAYLIQSSLQNKNDIKANYTEEKKKSFTFSKFLTIQIIIAFLISIIFFSISWIFLDRFPTALFNYISLPFMTILPSYIAKDIIEKRAISRNDINTIGNIVDIICDVYQNGSSFGSTSHTDALQNIRGALSGTQEDDDNEEQEEFSEEEDTYTEESEEPIEEEVEEEKPKVKKKKSKKKTEEEEGTE